MATKLRAIVSGNMTRHRKASDIEVTITSPKDKVRCILKSLETYLRVFGLYCEACNFKKTESRKRLLRVAISVSNINSFVFFVCAWSNEIRLIPMLLEDWEHGYKIMLILLMILTYVCSSWGFTCLMLLNHKHYPAISRSLELITTVPTFPLVLQQFALFVNLCIAISVVFPIYSLLSVFQDGHEPTLMTTIRLAPSEPRTTLREVLKYVYAYFTILAFIHAVLYSVFLSVVCYILKREFEDICERLQTLAADGDDSWKDGEVERLRLQHDKVCQATRTADRVISYLVFGIFLAATLLVCFCISCLIHGFYPNEGIPFLIAFSVSTFGQAVITTVYGVMLNHQAHRPHAILPRIGVAKLTQEDYRSLSLFLGQVSGRSIGITVMGLFTINRPAIITIIGTIIAYAVVIQQLSVNKVRVTDSVPNVTVSSNVILDSVRH